MSVRSALRALIFQEPLLLDEIPQDRWAARGSLDLDALSRPFAIIASVGDNRFLPGATRSNVPRDFEIWIHDDAGSYVLVDKVISLLRKHLDASVDFSFAGFRVSQVDVQSESPDLQDDVLRTLTRSLRVRVLGSAL